MIGICLVVDFVIGFFIYPWSFPSSLLKAEHTGR